MVNPYVKESRLAKAAGFGAGLSGDVEHRWRLGRKQVGAVVVVYDPGACQTRAVNDILALVLLLVLEVALQGRDDLEGEDAGQEANGRADAHALKERGAI